MGRDGEGIGKGWGGDGEGMGRGEGGDIKEKAKTAVNPLFYFLFKQQITTQPRQQRGRVSEQHKRWLRRRRRCVWR